MPHRGGSAALLDELPQVDDGRTRCVEHLQGKAAFEPLMLGSIDASHRVLLDTRLENIRTEHGALYRLTLRRTGTRNAHARC